MKTPTEIAAGIWNGLERDRGTFHYGDRHELVARIAASIQSERDRANKLVEAERAIRFTNKEFILEKAEEWKKQFASEKAYLNYPKIDCFVDGFIAATNINSCRELTINENVEVLKAALKEYRGE